MKIEDIPTAMDEFYRLVQTKPSTDAPEVMIRLAATMPDDVAITALARLLTIVHARAEHDRARLRLYREQGGRAVENPHA